MPSRPAWRGNGSDAPLRDGRTGWRPGPTGSPDRLLGNRSARRERPALPAGSSSPWRGSRPAGRSGSARQCVRFAQARCRRAVRTRPPARGRGWVNAPAIADRLQGRLVAACARASAPGLTVNDERKPHTSVVRSAAGFADSPSLGWGLSQPPQAVPKPSCSPSRGRAGTHPAALPYSSHLRSEVTVMLPIHRK